MAQVVTECAAICAYLADAFPDAGLAPPTDDRADYYRWLFFAAGPVEHAVTNNDAGLRVPARAGPDVRLWRFRPAIDVLEQAVAEHDYVAGDRFTMADVYVGSQVIWGIAIRHDAQARRLRRLCRAAERARGL